MIAIVDYGMGNLRSVQKGFQKVGVDVTVTSHPQVIDDAEAVVLPGVGAFRDCIRNLSDLSLTDAVVRSIKKGKPYLGICLGMQVLFSESEEFGRCRGLDIFRGKVVRFGAGMKVPHMGWNTVTIEKRPPVFGGLRTIPTFISSIPFTWLLKTRTSFQAQLTTMAVLRQWSGRTTSLQHSSILKRARSSA